jgi:hypothetical protein
MKLSNFSVLSQREIAIVETISQEYSRYTVPIKIDWDKLDATLFSSYYDKLSRTTEIDISDIPEYSKRCLIFWRGISVEKQSGYFRLQKFDLLLQKIIAATGLQQLGYALKITTPPQQSNFLESEKSAPAVRPGSFPPISIERKSLSLDYNLSSLWRKEEVMEPSLDEVILMYRKGSNRSDPKGNPNGIYIQRFHNVPLKDLPVVFPEKKKSRNFADIFYAFMIASWLLTVLFKLQHAWASATYIDEAMIAVLLVFLPLLLQYFAKTTVSRLRSSRLRNALTGDSLYQNSLNCNRSVLGYCRDESVQQTVLNSMLAYFVLLKAGRGLTGLEVAKECTNIIHDHFDEKINFNIDIALKLIEQYQFAIRDPATGCYVASSLGTVTDSIQHLFQKSIVCAF